MHRVCSTWQTCFSIPMTVSTTARWRGNSLPWTSITRLSMLRSIQVTSRVPLARSQSERTCEMYPLSPAEEPPREDLEGQRSPIVGVGRGEHGPDDFPAALTARCSLSPYAQPMVSRSCAARPRMVRCYRARSSCDALPIFLLIALLLLVRESLRPSVGDFEVAASENEEFPSFTCSAGVRCCGVARARGIAPLEGIWRPERCGFTRSYGHCGMACREV